MQLQRRYHTRDDDRPAQADLMAPGRQELAEDAENQSPLYKSQTREGRRSKDQDEEDSPVKRVAVEVDHRLEQSSGIYSSSVGQSKYVSAICYSPRLKHHKDDLYSSYPRSYQTRNSMNFESPNTKIRSCKKDKRNEVLVNKVCQVKNVNATVGTLEGGKDTDRGNGEEAEGGRGRSYFLQVLREDGSDRDEEQDPGAEHSRGDNDLQAIRDGNISGGSAQASNKPLLFEVSIPQ